MATFVETQAIANIDSTREMYAADEFVMETDDSSPANAQTYASTLAGTIEQIRISAASNTSGEVKALVCDSSGNILATATWASGTFSDETTWSSYASLSSNITNVAVNDTFIVALAVETGSLVYGVDTTTDSFFRTGQDTTGSYSTPPDPIDITPAGLVYRRFNFQLDGTESGGGGSEYRDAVGDGIGRGIGRGIA